MTLMPAFHSFLATTFPQGNGQVKRIIIESDFTPTQTLVQALLLAELSRKANKIHIKMSNLL
jgi:hypothetical protein